MASNKLCMLGMESCTIFYIFYRFKVSDSDSSLFVKLESQIHLLVLLYVDDMKITDSDEEEISRLEDDLSIRFEMKNLCVVEYFLGLELEKTSKGYCICQRRYSKNLLKHFSMGEEKEMATPMEMNLKIKVSC